MAASKKKKSVPMNAARDKSICTMLIRNQVPAEDFLKAYGKKHGANTLYPVHQKRKRPTANG